MKKKLLSMGSDTSVETVFVDALHIASAWICQDYVCSLY